MTAIPTVAPEDDIVASWGTLVAEAINALAQPIGVECPVGATVTGIAGTGAEIKVGAPVGDPDGYWDSGTGRLTIPADKGGLYSLTMYGVAIGGTSGNARRITATIGGVLQGAGGTVGAGATGTFWTLGVTCQMPGGSAIVITASGLTTPADFTISRAQLYRIGLSG
jgi:hypothetical protein